VFGDRGGKGVQGSFPPTLLPIPPDEKRKKGEKRRGKILRPSITRCNKERGEKGGEEGNGGGGDDLALSLNEPRNVAHRGKKERKRATAGGKMRRGERRRKRVTWLLALGVGLTEPEKKRKKEACRQSLGKHEKRKEEKKEGREKGKGGAWGCDLCLD